MTTTTINNQFSDDQIAEVLNLNLFDVSLELGDVVIPHGEVSHRVFQNGVFLGYIWQWREQYHCFDCYNCSMPESAALRLVTPEQRTAAINLFINRQKDLIDYI